MIKFEEHEGLLFRMLDKPVPLQENDVNVLVRFITHGVIGEYVMEHWLDCNQENVPIYIDDVDSDGDVTVWIDENRNSHHCCPFPMFEIIGTFVEEGSAEWALYQMMNGCKVTKGHLEHIYWHYDARPHLRCISEYNCGTLQIMVIPEIWIKTADKDGWQIHKESKPESQYKVGDWVEWCGDQYMIESAPPQSGGRYNIRSPYDELGCSVCPENITRKLSPYEVVIHIGCLSGTVRPVSTNGTHIWFHLIGVDDKTIATIRISSLDATTRELVESLISAQKEEEGE